MNKIINGVANDFEFDGIETFNRWQDPTIDDLIKENFELKRKLGEADEAVEYWQIECNKRSKVLDKIKEKVDYYKSAKYGTYDSDDILADLNYIFLELLEEVE